MGAKAWSRNITMGRRVLTALVVFLLFVFVLSGIQPGKATYMIRVSDDMVRVEISQRVHQNVTSFPLLNVSVAVGNASTALALFQDALQAKAPEVRLEGIELRANSNSTDLEVRVNLNLTGVRTESSGIVRINMDWKSFAVAGEPVEGVTINEVGANVLFQPVDALLVEPTRESNSRAFINDQGPVRFDQVREKIKALSLLNFSDLARPLEYWGGGYDFVKDLTHLTMKSETRLRILFVEVLPEPFPEDFIVSYENQAEVEIPGFASVSQDQVIIGEGSSTAIMAAVIAGTLATGVATTIAERRILPRRRRR